MKNNKRQDYRTSELQYRIIKFGCLCGIQIKLITPLRHYYNNENIFLGHGIYIIFH